MDHEGWVFVSEEVNDVRGIVAMLKTIQARLKIHNFGLPVKEYLDTLGMK
jgi:hypothetical protein